MQWTSHQRAPSAPATAAGDRTTETKETQTVRSSNGRANDALNRQCSRRFSLFDERFLPAWRETDSSHAESNRARGACVRTCE